MSNDWRLSELRIRRAGLHPGWLAMLAILAFLMLGAVALVYGSALVYGLQVVVPLGLMFWSWQQRAQLKQLDLEIQRMRDEG